MTAVSIRIVAPDEETLRRAISQLEHQIAASIPMPSHPGRKGDWLGYGSFEVYIPANEPTRRRPAGHGESEARP